MRPEDVRAGVETLLRRLPNLYSPGYQGALLENARRTILLSSAPSPGNQIDADVGVLAHNFAIRLRHLVEHIQATPEARVEERDRRLGLDAVVEDYLVHEFGDRTDQRISRYRDVAEASWDNLNQPSSGLLAVLRYLDVWGDLGASPALTILMQLVWEYEVPRGPASTPAVASQPAPIGGGAEAGVRLGGVGTQGSGGATGPDWDEGIGFDEEPLDELSAEGPGAEAPADFRKIPALTLGVLQGVHRAFWSPGRRVVTDGDATVLMDQRETKVGQLELVGLSPERKIEISTDAINLTGKVEAHRLLRWLVAKSLEDGLGRPDARTIVVEGGLQQLAQNVGLHSGARGATRLGSLLDVFQRLAIVMPDDQMRPLLSWSVTPSAPGRRALLSILLDEPLMPALVHSLGKSPRERDAKRLVPVPRELPPLLHESRDGQLAALQLLVLAEFRRQASAFYLSEKVVIPPERWREFLEAAGLPVGLLVEIMAGWCGSVPTGAFLWRAVGEPPDAFRLTARYTEDAFMIANAGFREESGRARQRRGARRSG